MVDVGGAIRSRITTLSLPPHRAFPPSQSIPLRVLYDGRGAVNAPRYVHNMRDIHATTYCWEAYSAMGNPGFGVLDIEMVSIAITTQRVGGFTDRDDITTHPYIQIYRNARSVSSLNVIARAAARLRLVWMVMRSGIVEEALDGTGAYSAYTPLRSAGWTLKSAQWLFVLAHGMILPEEICFASTCMCPDANKASKIIFEDVLRAIKGSLLAVDDRGVPVVKSTPGKRPIYIIDHRRSTDATGRILADLVNNAICAGYDERDVTLCVGDLLANRIHKARNLICTIRYGEHGHMHYCIDADTLNKRTSDIETAFLSLLHTSLLGSAAAGSSASYADSLPRASHNPDLLLLSGGPPSTWLTTIPPSLPGLDDAQIDGTYALALVNKNTSRVVDLGRNGLAGAGSGAGAIHIGVSVHWRALCDIVAGKTGGDDSNLQKTALGVVMTRACPIGWKQALMTAIEPQGRPNELMAYNAVPSEEGITIERPNRMSEDAIFYEEPDADPDAPPPLHFEFDHTKLYVHIPPGPLFYWFLSYLRVWNMVRMPLPQHAQIHTTTAWCAGRMRAGQRIRLARGPINIVDRLDEHVAHARVLVREYAGKGGIDCIALRAVSLAQEVLAAFPTITDPIIHRLAGLACIETPPTT
jgi:hypothetical protein